jgi:5-formyltetrahydrofolate cyclo-ligase
MLIEKNSTIGVYLSIHSEVDLTDFIEEALKNSLKLAAPVVVTDESHPLLWRRLNTLSDLPKNVLGVREPLPSEEAVDKLDAVLVPGLLYNERGYRLGYGGGYYDRFLADSSAVSIGCFFSSQLSNDFREESHDVALQHILTERGFQNVH